MRTVLWDLDGTIADTAELHFQAWQLAMQTYGVRYDRAQFEAGFGRSNGSILSELLQVSPDAPIVAQAALHKEQTFRSLLADAQLAMLPGVAQWLDAFDAAGVRQVVASSGAMANITAMVAALGIGDYFVALLTGAPLARGKPHPDLFLLAASAAGVQPGSCIVIEDSIHGVEAARRAGMGCVAVGPLHDDPALAAHLAAPEGPPCIPLATLSSLTWEMCHELWAETTHSKDHPVTPDRRVPPLSTQR